jgi:hypothetical protein
LTVLESLQGDAAFEALFHLADIVLESSQRFYFAFEDHYIVAQYASSRPFNRAVDHVAACNLPDLRNAEDLTHFGVSGARMLERSTGLAEILQKIRRHPVTYEFRCKRSRVRDESL